MSDKIDQNYDVLYVLKYILYTIMIIHLTYNNNNDMKALNEKIYKINNTNVMIKDILNVDFTKFNDINIDDLYGTIYSEYVKFKENIIHNDEYRILKHIIILHCIYTSHYAIKRDLYGISCKTTDILSYSSYSAHKLISRQINKFLFDTKIKIGEDLTNIAYKIYEINHIELFFEYERCIILLLSAYQYIQCINWT